MNYKEMIYEKAIKETCQILEMERGLRIEQILSPILNDKNFDVGKYKEWLSNTNISYTSNPMNYLNKAFNNEFRNGIFTFGVNYKTLFEELTKIGAISNEKDEINVEAINWYMVAVLGVKPENMKELNNNVINFMEEKGKTTNEDYIYLVSKSKFANSMGFKTSEYDLAKEYAEENMKEYKELKEQVDILVKGD